MTNAIIYGGASGLALLIGAWSGIYFKFKRKTIARFMAFGSGLLVCALTFGLMEEAFNQGGFDAAILGFVLGGLVFIGGDYLIHIFGGRRHKRTQNLVPKVESTGLVITLGALLDGIPESIALGIAIFNGAGTGLLMLIAIILSNFPEGISSIRGLRKENFSNRQIYSIWMVVAVLAFATTILSFLFLHDINPNIIGSIEAFAAGAILAMLADSMMPEAFEEGGFSIGALTVAGFLLAFILAKI
ncbi:MAG: ZIP family metal transporter [Patescibacteria group bacterium]